MPPTSVGLVYRLRIHCSRPLSAEYRLTNGLKSPYYAPVIPIFINILLFVHILVCVFLVLIVLMQRPKQEGLGAAFGGGMMNESFGAQTTDVLQKSTRFLAVCFFVITALLSVLNAAQARGKTVESVEAEASPLIEAPEIPAAPAGEAAIPTPAPIVPTEAPATTDTEAAAETPAVESETSPPAENAETEGESTDAPAPAETSDESAATPPAPAEGESN